jgi:glutamyl/glutaminyl-tRNA synthetase
VKRFDFASVTQAPAQFDEAKLRWINGRYLHELPLEELTERVEAFVGRDGLGPAVAIAGEKIQTLAEFWPLCGFIWDGPTDDAKAREKWLGAENAPALAAARSALEVLAVWSLAEIEAALRGVVESQGVKPNTVFQPVRVALAGTTVSPGIFETLELLGREESLKRLDAAI